MLGCRQAVNGDGQMTEKIPYGERVLVTDLDYENIGPGTYLESVAIEELAGMSTPRILLDRGVCIYGYACHWVEYEKTPAPPALPYTLTKDIRVFVDEGRILCKIDEILRAGTEIVIESLPAMYFDHRPQVAAAITLNGGKRFLLTSELEFPEYGDESD